MTRRVTFSFRIMAFATLVLIFLGGALPEFANADEPGAGQQVAQTFEFKSEGEEPGKLAYWLYLPKSYDGKEKMPLVVFLHGSGERGDDLEVVKKWGPPKQVAEGKELNFILVSPQCPSGERWNADVLAAMVRQIQERWSVDRDRTYITGLSMGGYGTWNLLAQHADLFAAAIPVCGGGDPEQAKKMVKVPIWVFHGAKDDSVPLQRSEEMVAAVKSAGGEVKFTVYPELGHNSWSEAYGDPETFQWLLKQKRK